MYQPSLYSKYNGLQKTDASFVIDNYLRLVHWKNNGNILDVGCGDGDVTFELLLPKIPNFNKIVCSDVSFEMVQYAKKRCREPKSEFIALDITCSTIPRDLQANFDHIFSFYVLHWIMNQRQAVKNLFNLLKPGGEMLLTFLQSNPVYDIYEILAKSNKWSPYMQNIHEYVSPYHHSKNAEAELEKLLKEEGFNIHLCRAEHRTYTFPNFTILSKSVAAVNPFIRKLPIDEVDNYIRDYLKEVRKLKSVTIKSGNNNNDEEQIHMPYKLFIVFASKPL